MVKKETIFLNTGIYTVPEASRLTRVSAGRIRRWLRGYKFYSGKKPHRSPPLWTGQLDPIDGHWALGFLDLVEIKCVDSFVKAGVSWTLLRKAHEIGIKMFGEPHPFCIHRFATDGREIFVELHEETGERGLLDIATSQRVFRAIVAPFFKELEFEAGDVLARWRPRTSRGLVVLDPARSFGQPIVAQHGIRTDILARSARATGSVKQVSQWYEVPTAEVEDAVEFEDRLAE